MLYLCCIYALQQFSELLRSQSCVTCNSAHCERIDRIMPWDGNNSRTVSHDDVAALSGDPKPSLLECTDRITVTYTWDLRHDLYRNFDLSEFGLFG